MRISSSVSWFLVIAFAIVSVSLWRELRTERQVVADLRTQLDEARVVAPEVSLAEQLAASRLPQAPAAAAVSTEPLVAPADQAVQAVQAVQEAVGAALRAEMARRDSESQETRLARARSELRRRNLTLATDLGLSVQETDALFTILGESSVRRESELMSLMNSGAATDDARRAEMSRLEEELKQQERAQIVARLGAERAAEIQEYQETQPARLRVTNFSGMLASRGAALTDAQSKSLASLMVVEQRRQESEAPSAPTSPSVRVEREIESDRRILDAAAKFLNPQQMEFMSTKFEELWEGKKAAIAR